MDLTTEAFLLIVLDEFSTPSSPTPISSRLPSMQKRRRSAQVYFDTVRQRRQSAIRLQCDPKNAAGIRSYIERFLSSQASSSSTSSSGNQTYMPPPTSAPMQGFEPAEQRMDSSSEDDEGEAEAFKALSLSDRCSGASTERHGSYSGSGRRKSYAVQKSSRSKTKLARRNY